VGSKSFSGLCLMDHWRHIHIAGARSACLHMSYQSREPLITTFGQMYLVSHPPHGQFAPIGGLNIVGGADHFRWRRNIIIGAQVRLVLDAFKLLYPDTPQRLYRWDVV